METTVMNVAVSQGIWAVLAVFLLIYIVKSNDRGIQSRKNERKITRR